ncbi:unnamed protein product [Camellia sinensis]
MYRPPGIRSFSSSQEELPQILITIKSKSRANNLPNMDSLHKKVGELLRKFPGNVSNKIEGNVNVARKMRQLIHMLQFQSPMPLMEGLVISNNENPVWMQHFNVPVAHYAAEQLWSGTKLEGMGSCIPVMRRLRSSSSILQCKFCFVPDLLEKEIAGSKSSGPVAGCPREPWHDLHCQIDGPAAYDIFTNFEERWLRASKPHGLQKMTKSHDDSLLIIDRIPDIIGITDVSCLNEDGPEAWHVQGFPKDPKDATSRNLVCGKNVLIDMSIHTAYVKAIRAAQHFIYIENQYFLGSSHNWTNHRDLGANNLIPMEIALKIANKIREKERFSAYIVIPMWPGGVPTGAPTQRILLWQHNTMQMMYEEIYKALEEVGLEKKYEPQDYLNFFCLGNRVARDREDTSDAGNATTKNHSQELTRKNRRFMIDVHSKGMIVDDEYMILASANINQRSLESTRDTEIAMGAYQPHYTWASKHSTPRGQVHGYRMSLWSEHIGALEECFKHPESLECIRRVRSLSELNWKQYAANEVTDMKGHLLKYPVEVDQMGKVKPIPGCETFPDVGGNIIGSLGPINIKENLTI